MPQFSAQMVSTSVADRACLGVMIASPLALALAQMGLIGNLNGGATKNQIIGNITPPAYTGYAPSGVLAWTAIINEQDGTQTAFSSQILFQQTGVTGAVISGIYLYAGSSSPSLLALGLFVQPITLVNNFDGFVVTACWNQGANGINMSFDVDQ